jgi:hypothetical protein
MTSVDTRVPTKIVATGIDQDTYITQPSYSTVQFAPNGNKNLIVISCSSGTAVVTANAVTACNMPLACYQGSVAGKPNDHGLHNFVMSVDSGATSPETFVLPYVDHYTDDTGLVTLTVSSTLGNMKIGIFEMP